MFKQIMLGVVNSRVVNEMYRAYYISCYPMTLATVGIHKWLDEVGSYRLPKGLLDKVADRVTDTCLADKPLRYVVECLKADFTGKGIIGESIAHDPAVRPSPLEMAINSMMGKPLI